MAGLLPREERRCQFVFSSETLLVVVLWKSRTETPPCLRNSRPNPPPPHAFVIQGHRDPPRCPRNSKMLSAVRYGYFLESPILGKTVMTQANVRWVICQNCIFLTLSLGIFFHCNTQFETATSYAHAMLIS